MLCTTNAGRRAETHALAVFVWYYYYLFYHFLLYGTGGINVVHNKCRTSTRYPYVSSLCMAVANRIQQTKLH